MVQIVLRNLVSLLLRLACHVLAVILDESQRREERSCSMVKTTTKTNFTKNVKYKVGTIKSVTDLMANKAICEGDDAPLDVLYSVAVRCLEKFVHEKASIEHTNMVGQAYADAAMAAASKLSNMSESTGLGDDVEGVTDKQEDKAND